MLWHLFTRLLFSKRAGSLVRGISLLSFIGITLSVAAFLLVLFVMSGMNESIKERILGLEPHIVVEVENVKDSKAIETQPVWMRIQDIPDAQASSYETQDVIVRTMDGLFRGAIARGVSEKSMKIFIQQLADFDRRTGNTNQWLDLQDVPKAGEVLIGESLAKGLGIFEGDYLNIIAPESLLLPPGEVPKLERVKVKKIVSTGLNELDATLLYYLRGTSLTKLARESKVQVGIEMWLPTGASLAQIKEDLQRFDGVKVETWMDRNSAMLFALKLEKMMIGIFLGLAGILAGSSILTVLSLLISQKRKDIALLQTMGLSSHQVVHLFTKMGVLLSGGGVLLGMLIGISTGYYIQQHPLKILPAIYVDNQLPAKVEIGLIILVAFLSAVLILIGSWLPARSTTQIRPAEALRFD